MEMSKKKLVEMGERLGAIDITNLSFEKCKELNKKIYKENIAISYGIYGAIACLFHDKKSGKYYMIKARNATLFFFM